METSLGDALRVARHSRKQSILVWSFSLFSASALVLLVGASFLVKPILIRSPIVLNGVELRFADGNGRVIFHDYLLAISKEFEIEVSAYGHESKTVIYHRSDGDLIVDLDPSLVQVDLQLEGGQSGLPYKWYVDDKLVGQGISVSLLLEQQPVQVIVSIGNCNLLQTEISPSYSEAKLIPLDLSLSGLGSKRLDSDPRGVDVSHKGIVIGKTPLNLGYDLYCLPLTLRKPGFADKELLLDDNLSDEIFIAMRRRSFPIPVSVEPSGGVLAGGTLNASETTAFVEKLPAVVSYSKFGYFEKTFQVVSQDSLNIRLLPNFARLLIDTVPADAKVTVRSSDSKSEVKQYDKLIAGDYQVNVSAEGYVSQELDFRAAPGNEHKLSIQLETREAFVLRTSPRSYKVTDIGIDLVRVRGERFSMGAPRQQRGQRANEILRDVGFSREFYIGKHEVTQAQYANFKGSLAGDEPVSNITWTDAALFCNWLSRKSGLTEFYKVKGSNVIGISGSNGYRLPTEAEWEYVARYYKKKNPSIFVWGDDYVVDKRSGNIADSSAANLVKRHIGDYTDGFERKAPVGLISGANAVFDMSGNVSEWVHDFYILENFGNEFLLDYAGPSGGTGHTVKGSSYLSSRWEELRATYRDSLSGSREDVGFRVARYVY